MRSYLIQGIGRLSQLDLLVLGAVLLAALVVYGVHRWAQRASIREMAHARIRQHALGRPRLEHEESERELLARLGITETKGREIAWDYAQWASDYPFRRKKLRHFIGVQFELGDREHLAQLYVYSKYK